MKEGKEGYLKMEHKGVALLPWQHVILSNFYVVIQYHIVSQTKQMNLLAISICFNK